MRNCSRSCLLTFTAIVLSSCATSWTGTVQRVEAGKDGHTAYLTDRKGEKFDAILSIPKMGENYRLLAAGENVKLSGDTIHLDNRVRVIVRKVKVRSGRQLGIDAEK